MSDSKRLKKFLRKQTLTLTGPTHEVVRALLWCVHKTIEQLRRKPQTSENDKQAATHIVIFPALIYWCT